MKPAPFLYVRPESLEDIVERLAEAGDDAKLLAGGQSLVPMLNFRLARPALLIDLGLADELTAIVRRNGELAVGAGVRQRDAETSDDVRDACPLLPQALRYVGHLQTRNRGTVGGSLAHADPAAELAAVTIALEGQLVALSRRGRRLIPAGEFFLGPFTTALEPDEILVEVRLPVRHDLRTAFLELARREGDFAVAGVAAAVSTTEPGGSITEARIAVIGTGFGGRPVRLRRTEELLFGKGLEAAVRAEARAAAREELRSSPATPEADYARRVASVLVERALARVDL